jgi:hypothetical protein
VPRGWSGWVWKNSHAPRFDPWNIQPKATSYTDYVNPTHGVTYQKATIFINWGVSENRVMRKTFISKKE